MDKYEMDYSEKTIKNSSSNSNSHMMLNRSFTINQSSEISKKPLYHVYASTAFQRKGSIKNIYNSSFESVVSAGNSFKGKVKKLCSVFESPKEPPFSTTSQSLPSPTAAPTKSTKLLLPAEAKSVPDYVPPSLTDSPIRLPGTEDRVVIYFTSLRGIRRTFQDCHSIRLIFRGFRVILDERDIAMDIGYRKELQKLLGENDVSLPQVFIRGKYIGGADEVRQLLEAGELAKMLKGLPLRALKPCDVCNDIRFVPCTRCDGSRKVFDEVEEQLKRCPECNENGLVRCPLCCS